MYATYGDIYHQYTPNVSIYTIHGSYGIVSMAGFHQVPSPFGHARYLCWAALCVALASGDAAIIVKLRCGRGRPEAFKRLKGVPNNGWFMLGKTLLKWMMTGGTPILGNLHLWLQDGAPVH